MKTPQALVFAAQLATIAAAEYMPELIPDFTNYNISDGGFPPTLNGTEALDYLFKYDPTRPHFNDLAPVTVRDEDGAVLRVQYQNYDTGYLGRICSPSIMTEEGTKLWMNSSAFTAIDPSDYLEKINEYQVNLDMWRIAVSGSPYPCERLFWIMTECGMNPRMDSEHRGTLAEQHQCMCKGDYWAAYNACQSCYDFHTGNATEAAEVKSLNAVLSSSFCAEAPSATRALSELHSSVFGLRDDVPRVNVTIVKDGAPGKTDASLYFTPSVDFVPATIQEPAFTRTIGEVTVVMTPGPVAGKAVADPTAGTTAGTTTGSASSATSSTAGAADVKVAGGLMMAALGAVMML